MNPGIKNPTCMLSDGDGINHSIFCYLVELAIPLLANLFTSHPTFSEFHIILGFRAQTMSNNENILLHSK